MKAAKGHPALERRVLARMGNFLAAAEAGWRAIAVEGVEPEDYYRLAQILLKIGAPEEALGHGLAALRARPDETRYVVPVVEAVLTAPRLEQRLRVALGAGGIPPEKGIGPAINLPVDLPHYGPFDGPHPWVMGLVEAVPEFAFTRQKPVIADLAAAMLAGLPRALALTDQLTRIHPLVDRRAAAQYVAHRFPSCLYPVEGAALDLLPFLPMSLAERPFVMVFDFLGNLFSPPQPFEDMEVDPRKTPMFWILRAAFESAACRGIIANYAEVGPLLGRFFQSPAIEAKTVFINPVSSIDELREAAAVTPERPTPPPGQVTLLFTSSLRWKEEGFYARGGVDVVNAFLALAETHPGLRLILRSGLPASLSPRLREAITSHPRILWRPDFMDWPAYRAMLLEADLFVMPAVTMYRNGLIQAMRWGIVPVIADCMHAHELVRDGETGLVVRGRGHRASVSAADGRYVGDWVDLLRGVDRPADATFFERFTEALTGLIATPARIATLRARLLADPGSHCYGPADRDRFAGLLARALDGAEAADLSPEAVFPVQPVGGFAR
jgi:glycosyltransferase involved in cell wall biosynthesis